LDSILTYGTTEDYQLKDGTELPEGWFTARDVKRGDLDKFVAMRLPADPYMHIFFFSWHNLSTRPQWPVVMNQIGSRSFTFLMDDVETELTRIKKEFPSTEILGKPVKIERKWGTTTSAVLKDPEGAFLELVSIEGGRFKEENAKVPDMTKDINLLHFQVNCTKYDETSKFYRAFGM
jgi:predicted enzyme related to lactoylglutathione lyase